MIHHNLKLRPDRDTIDTMIREVAATTSLDELVFRRNEVLAQLYQVRALNEIAQSLYEIVRDGIGVKRDD